MAALLVASILAACGSSATRERSPCTTDDDCPNGSTCDDGTCTPIGAGDAGGDVSIDIDLPDGAVRDTDTGDDTTGDAGDGTVDDTEDDANNGGDGDGASGGRCGDGVVDEGEACDDGAANSDVEPNACRTDCTLAGCGDGVVDAEESCDDGEANSDEEPDACRTDCSLPVCGDGVVDEGEMCDDPDEPRCDEECVLAPRALCEPCDADAECGDEAGRCIAIAEEAATCARVCETDDDCPTEFVCGDLDGSLEETVCLPRSEVCSDCIDLDEDGFGYGDGCAGADCAPEDDLSFPDAEEICDGVDNDCDGEIDEGIELLSFWPDRDGDGYGDGSAEPVEACSAPGTEFVTNGDDCDDEDENRSPDADEIVGDGIDTDCDGEEFCFVDDDGDGFRTTDIRRSSDLACDGEGEAELTAPDGDCDDGDDSVNPDATESCDGVDNDCDDIVDEPEAEDATSWFVDSDGDGFGDSDAEPVVACERPEGAAAVGGDCNDEDAAVHPDADELPGDGVDQNCDREELCFVDEDEDGFHAGEVTTSDSLLCDESGLIGEDGESGDCNDSDPSVRPGATELIDDGVDQNCDGVEVCFADGDNDGFRSERLVESPSLSCEGEGVAPGDAPAGDCVDTDAEIFPGAEERCDAIDNDCDEAVDEREDGTPLQRFCYSGPLGTSGVGPCRAGRASCDEGVWGDCVGEVTPSDELCDGLDNDCNGEADDDLVFRDYFRDRDRDGVGDSDFGVNDCIAPEGHVLASGDCNDNDPSILPGAPELCDGLDNDCNGDVDDGLTFETWYADRDDDGFGDDDTSVEDCSRPTGFVAVGGDCEDEDSSIFPGAPELCDGLDNDCNEIVDDETGPVSFYPDRDGDGFGDAGATPIVSCEPPAGDGWVTNGRDCNDRNEDVNPTAAEVCNRIDDDCNGMIDDDVVEEGVGLACYGGPEDTEGIGACRAGILRCTEGSLRCEGSVEPSEEICDGRDNDCNGSVPSSELERGCAGDILLDEEIVVTRVEFPLEVKRADLHFNIDTTGSMGGVISRVRDTFLPISTQVLETIPDSAFGVSTFEDFPVSGFGISTDRPFELWQRVTTDADLAQRAVERTTLGSGSDFPESGFESIYQIATGGGTSWPNGTEPATSPTGLRGFLGERTDDDLDDYLVDVPVGSTLTVRAIGASAVPGSELDPYVRVYDAAGELLAERNDGFRGTDDTELEFTPEEEAGPYTVRVTACCSASTWGFTTGWYLLSADVDGTLLLPSTDRCSRLERGGDSFSDDGEAVRLVAAEDVPPPDTDRCRADCSTATSAPEEWLHTFCGGDPPEEVCGDGAVTGGERCDDGGTADGDGCTSTCQLEVGEVPAFDPDAGFEESLGHGRIGGVGFRAGSFPLILHFTDADSHFAEDYTFGPPDFAVHTHDEMLEAVRAIGARVIGIENSFSSTPDPVSEIETPRGIAWATNAVVPVCAFDGTEARLDGTCGEDECCTGDDGEGEAPVERDLCPLVFQIASGGDGLAAAVVDGIDALARFGRYRITPVVRDDPSDDIDASCLIQGISVDDLIEPASCTARASFLDLDGDGLDETVENAIPSTRIIYAFQVGNSGGEGGDEACVPSGSYQLFVDIFADDAVLLATQEITVRVP